MGAYAPAPCLPPCLCKEAVEQVVKKCINGLKNEGIVYEGVLYAGLMLTKKGIEVLEFNCRFGDPETEVVLLALENDLYEVVNDVMDGNLDSFINGYLKWLSLGCPKGMGGDEDV